METRIFLEDSKEVESFKSFYFDFLRYLKIINPKLSEGLNKNLSDFESFLKELSGFEKLDQNRIIDNSTQEVFESKPHVFKNKIFDVNVYLVKKADYNYMLNFDFKIVHTKFCKQFLEYVLSRVPEDDFEDLIENVKERFQDDFRLYLRLKKEDVLNDSKTELTYEGECLWIKFSPDIYVKNYIKNLKEVKEELKKIREKSLKASKDL